MLMMMAWTGYDERKCTRTSGKETIHGYVVLD